MVQCAEDINAVVAGWLDMWQQRQVSMVLASSPTTDVRQQAFDVDVEDTREEAIAENAPDGKKAKRKGRVPKEYATGEDHA